MLVSRKKERESEKQLLREDAIVSECVNKRAREKERES